MADSISEILSNFKKQDVYSLMLSFLYDLRQVPEYTLLSELCYALDKESLFNMINAFDGQKIQIPTKKEFSEVLQILMLYQYYVVEGRPWKDALAEAHIDSSSGKAAHNKIEKMKELLTKYNYGNR